jgi:hypothetical protein
MKIDDKQIVNILLRENYITEEELKKSEEYAKKNNVPLADYLINQGIITNDLMGQAMAESFGVDYADLNSQLPPREQVLKIPEPRSTGRLYLAWTKIPPR